MSQFFSSSSLIFNQLVPSGRGKRAFGTLFLIAALVVAAMMIVTVTTRAAAPSLVGGGPPAGQSSAPVEALVDINNASEAFKTSGVGAPNVTMGTANVELLECTGTSDATTCPATTGANLCTAAPLTTGTGGANSKITCDHAALGVNKTYRFRIIGVDVDATNAVRSGDGASDGASTGTRLVTTVTRLFRTSGFAGSTNTTPPRVVNSSVNPGAIGVPANVTIVVEFPTGPEGDMKTTAGGGGANAVDNNANITLQALTMGVPSGDDLCGVTGCVLTWTPATRALAINPTDLAANTEYQLQISNVQNAGTTPVMMQPFIVRFTAGATDTTAPALRATGATEPANGALDTTRSNMSIAAYFTEALDQTTITLGTTAGLYIDNGAGGGTTNGTRDGTEALLGAAAFSSNYDAGAKTIRFGLLAPLTAGTKYCFQFTGGIRDIAGVALTPSQNQCFTTGSTSDSVAPTVSYCDADNFKVVCHFNEAMTESTLVTSNAVNTTNVAMECPTGVPVNLTGKTAVWGADLKEYEIQGLGLQNGQTCKVTFTGVTDISSQTIVANGTTNVGNFNVQNSTTTGGFLGAVTQDFSQTNFAIFALAPQRCQPRAQATSKATSVECEFPVPSALATSSTFLLTFPSGFTVTSAAAPAASVSHLNGDLNGPGPGTTTISSVTADNTAKTVTVTIAHSGTAMGATDQLRFELSGITTPAVAANDQRIAIIIKDASGVKQGPTLNAQPFQIQAAGMLEIKGAVFKDTDSDGVKDAGEGIANIKVYCNQMGGFTVGTTGGAMMGFQEENTDANGDFTFSGLTSGQYGCNIPPSTNLNNANVGGSNPFQNVTLASTSKTCVPAAGRTDCVDFKFTDLGAAGVARTLTVNVSGAPALTEMDAFCFAPGNFSSSAPIMKALTTNAGGAGTSTGLTTLKLQANVSYDCGIGPHMAFETFGTGTAPPVPTFSFMPPRPQQVVAATVAASPSPSITFALTSTTQTITGSVLDGSSAGIPSVFVHAEPTGCFGADGTFKQCNGAFAQTKSDGTFSLAVSDGVYEVGADGPGLPPSTHVAVSVKGASVANVTLKMVKSSTTISGTIYDESGNGIKYAHVSGQRITAGGTCSSFTPAGGFADSPTGSSGTYTLYTAAGTWCIRAFAPSYGEIGSKVVVVSGSTSQTGQDIAATAAEYGTITGTVTSGSTAVTSGFINCFGTSGGNGGQIGSDGTFSLKVKTGTGYTCDGFVPGVGPLTRQTGITVATTPTASQQLGTIALGGAGTITVTVTGISDGFCDAQDANGLHTGAPLNSGTATIKAQAGTYTVRCGSPKTGELVNQSAVSLTSAMVTAGTAATVSATSTLTTRSVVGQVTDGTANLEGVTLKFDDKTTGRAFTIVTGNISTAGTDNFSGATIPEGTYKVTASKKGYEAATTTATVSGGNLDLTPGATTLALTKATGSGTTGATVNIPVDAADGTTDYTGAATVIATKTEAGVVKTVVGELDATAGTAPLDLTAGTWTLTARGDNGKTVASPSTITIAAGAVVGSTPDLDLTTNIGGKTDAQLVTLLQTQSETVALSSGGLLKYKDLSVGGVAPEVNIPTGVLSATDSSTGKVDMKADTTLAIDCGTECNFVGASGYDITPKDASGNPITDVTGTVTITMPYTQADVTAAGVDESKLQFASFDTTSQSWETFPTTVDTVNNLLIASVSHFSSFGIIGGVSTSQAAGSPSDLTPPGAPTGVRLTSNGTSVTATWTDPTDSDFSRIVVLRNDGGTTPVTGDIRAIVAKGDQRYVDTTVTAGTTYKYILKSQDTSLNQRLTDEYSIAVTATAAGTVSAPVASAPPAASAPAASAPAASAPSVAAPAASAAPVARLIHDPSMLTELLAGLNQMRKPAEEAKYMPLIKSDALAFRVGLTAAQEATITNFVSYGHSTATVKLGAGERRAVLRDYLETVGRASVNFEDVERMTNGQKPVSRNLTKERAQVSVALKIFVKIYGHNPNFQVAEEDLAWNTLLYRVRFTRDLTKERAGIAEYRAMFGRTPRSPMDWATVRVLGYVKY